MSITIARFAAAQGISEQRARELARTGKVKAHRQGRAWVIDEDAHLERPRHRPLSAQSLAELLAVIAAMNFDSVTGVRKQRAAERLRKLRMSERPARLLAEWAGLNPARPQSAHQRAVLKAAQQGLDDYLVLVLREVDADDLSEPAVLRRRLRDAKQVNQLRNSDLAAAANVALEEVQQLLRDGRLRNFGATARIVQAAGLKPGRVPR